MIKNLTGKPSGRTASSKDVLSLTPRPTSDDYVDEDVELSDSDDEQEDAGTAHAPGANGTKIKRFSSFRVKKFMTDKMAKTSAGRATVMKVLGEEGNIVVEAIQSITTKVRDAKTAKANKKDAIRFCLKAYNLWKHKDFTSENTKVMQTNAQLLAEVFCRECTVASSGRKVDVSALVRFGMRLHDACVQLMTPFIQPKNAARMSELLKFHASQAFFDAIFNKPECEEEREALEKSVTTFLLPLSPILSGERERLVLSRLQTLLRVLENKRFESVLDHPQVTQIFQQYLDLELGLASKNDLKFVLAVRDFEKTASRELMRMRAPKIVERYLSNTAECSIGNIDPKIIDEIQESIKTGSVGMNTFLAAVTFVKKNLEDDFINQFATSQDYEDLKKRTAEEAAGLEKQLIDEGSLSTLTISQKPNAT